MKHSEYIEIAKGYGETALKNILLRVVIKKLPFLALGPANFLLVKLASWIAKEGVEEAEMRIFFEYVDFRTNAQAKDFEAAMIYNNTIQKIGTEEEKKIAEAKLTEALNALVSLRR